MILLIARPTPAGVNERGLAALADAVARRVAEPVRVAHLDQDEPTIHDALDEALADGTPAVTVVPLALPPDAYLTNWIGRAVANWRETRAAAGLDIGVEIGLAPALATTDPLADAVAALADAPTTAITALLREIADAGTAVLVVSHDRPRLRAYADRIVTMIDGRLEGEES